MVKKTIKSIRSLLFSVRVNCAKTNVVVCKNIRSIFYTRDWFFSHNQYAIFVVFQMTLLVRNLNQKSGIFDVYFDGHQIGGRGTPGHLVPFHLTFDKLFPISFSWIRTSRCRIWCEKLENCKSKQKVQKCTHHCLVKLRHKRRYKFVIAIYQLHKFYHFKFVVAVIAE